MPSITIKATQAILTFGNDARLVETRKWILERNGYQAHTAFSLLDMQQIALRESIDLFLLCDSLSSQARSEALASIHQQWPSAKLLVLASTRSAIALDGSEPIFLSREGPSRLVETIRTKLATDPA